MTKKSIRIRNLYVMLAYAFRAIRSDITKKMGEEEFEHLHDLLSEILIKGLNGQVKRGLYRTYLGREDELPTVRGQIDFGQTLTRGSRIRGRVICNYDEYLPDVPHNRALKSVITLLVRHADLDRKRRKELRRILPYFDGVTLISPQSIRWRDLNYHRGNAQYRLLLGVCELIVVGLLHQQNSGDRKLEAWISEEEESVIFERFLREYFRFHHPELSPSAPEVKWDLDPTWSFGDSQLPKMKTDLVLKSSSRTLIVDAKYYGDSLRTHSFGSTSKVHSANLYQILSYVKNYDVEQTGAVNGLLMYAQTDAKVQPDLDVVIQGNRIGAQALNLNSPWIELRKQLESITDWLHKESEKIH